jgi:tRNA(fMet)-specific endonuclease VapC
MYLLDTDTIIFFLNAVPEVVQNFQDHEADPKALSVVTYGELTYGAMKSARPLENVARVRRLSEILPVIDVSRATMDTFGSLKADGDRRGKQIDDFDWIIAATALIRGFTVVTNNEKHFVGIPGLKVENWSRR